MSKKEEEKTYRVYMTSGNGYNCSCCRQTWTDCEEFYDLESVRSYIEQIKIDLALGKKEDITIDEVLEVTEISLEDERIKFRPEKIEEVKEKQRREQEEEQEREELERQKKRLENLKYEINEGVEVKKKEIEKLETKLKQK